MLPVTAARYRKTHQDTTKTETDRSNYSFEFTLFQNYISYIGIKEFNCVSLFANVGNEVTIDSDANTFIMLWT